MPTRHSKTAASRRRRTRPVLEGMEPRLLYSADGLSALLDTPQLEHDDVTALDTPPVLPSDSQEQHTTPSAAETEATPTIQTELVVIDSRVVDYQKLVDDIQARSTSDAWFEIIVLNQIDSGISQITELLAQRQDVSAVHILSHGQDGGVEIGAGLIDGQALQQQAASLALWKAALTDNADVLVYGCDVAEGSAGQAFIQELARLTGADVAASSNVTGSAVLGGDWVLEEHIGFIDAPVLMSGVMQGTWQGTLATYTVINLNDTGVGSLREAITLSNASTTVDDTIVFAVSGTINVASTLTISDTVSINASSAGLPSVILDGNDLGTEAIVLTATADGSTIRGFVIRDFNADAIAIDAGSDGNTITGNYIGSLTLAGTNAGAAEANSLAGIYVQGSNVTITNNVISGNTWSGIEIDGAVSGTVISGNRIGVLADGVTALGNGQLGIYLHGGAANNMIGGTATGAGNIVAYSSLTGVGIDADGGSGNAILGNSIYGNGTSGNYLGINLNGGTQNGFSVTANDTGDGDAGPNALQNFPVLAAAGTDGAKVAIAGSINSTAYTTLRIEFFSNASADPSGHGEGQTYLGYTTVFTDGSGNANFVANFDKLVTAGQAVSATATVMKTGGTYASTSEFALNVSATGALIVDTINDTVDGTTTSVANLLASKGADGKISLREAIIATNNTAGQDTIFLPAGTYTLTRTGSSENLASTGDLDILQNLTLIGTGASSTIVNATGLNDRVFEVSGTGTSAYLSGITVTGGNTSSGGGILANGSTSLTLWDSVIANNTITGSTGGGLYTSGTTFINNVTVSGNSGASGAGIYSNNTLVINNSTISANTGSNQGAGLWSSGTSADLTLINTTISGNSNSGSGGGLYNGKTATLINVTIAGNTANQGGGIFKGAGTVTTTLLNTIVAGNTATSGTGPDISGAMTSSGTNIIGNTTGNSGWVASDKQNVNPLLGALQDNGGPTFTRALLAGSPAIDTGSATNAPAIDERGYLRDASIDIGAYEYNAMDPAGPAPGNTVPGAQATNEDVALVFSAANGNAITVNDANAGGNPVEVTLSVTNGTLTLAGTTGLTFTAGDGTADATMTLRGTSSDINTALNGLSYSPTADYSGGATLTARTVDSTLVSLNLDTSLKGSYTFENTSALGTDTSPLGGFTGTVNGATSVVDGTRGNVLSLDGNDYVQFTGHFGNPANVTLAAWVNLTTADTNGAEVITLGDSAILRLDDAGALRGYFWNGSAWIGVSYAGNLAGTGWHHVACTFDDTNNSYSLYLDGSQVATATTTNSIAYTLVANSFIGKNAVLTTYDFTGKIDDARIYNRALTAAEIAALAGDLAMTETDTVAITVNAVNDAPTDIVFDSEGSAESVVNTYTTSDQSEPAIAAFANGGYVAVWASNGQDTSNWGIYGQRFDATGAKIGAEFLVTNEVGDAETAPSVSTFADGGFVVAWQDQTSGVYAWTEARIFNADGTAVSAEFKVSPGVNGNNEGYQPAVQTLDSNRFVVVWSNEVGATTYEVAGRIYDRSGVLQGSQFTIGSLVGASALFGAQPEVSLLNDGGFAVVWRTYDGTNFDSRLRIMNNDGSVRSAEIVLQGDHRADVTGLDNGNVVAVYGDGTNISARIFNASGAQLMGEFTANTATAGIQSEPTITRSDDGFVVAWQSDTGDGSGTGIYAQRFDATGNRIGGEVLVNTTTAGAQSSPEAIETASGQVQLVWASENVDGSGVAVVSRVVATGNASVAENAANGTRVADVLGVLDVDAGDTASFSLTNSAGGRFAIDASTGVITVADGTLLDYESSTSHAITVRVTDGGGLTYDEVLTINVSNVNDVPANTVPGPQLVNEDTPLVFTGASQISIQDSDAGVNPVEVTVAVTNGTLTLSGTTGLTFIAGDGTADATMTVRGTVASINAALNGLTYLPTANYNGGALLTISTLDSALLSLNVDANLQGWYGFSGNTNDTSPGVVQNATLFNGAALTTDGTRGPVLTLDGIDDYAQITGTFSNPNEITIGGWVNLNDGSAVRREFITLNDRVHIALNEAGIGVKGSVQTAPGVWTDLASNQFLAAGGWRHVMYTYSDTANVHRLYIDGVQVASATINSSIDWSGAAGDTLIGRHPGNLHFLPGKVDDARIYDRALTAAEIATLAADLSLRDTDSVSITVNAVNDAPTSAPITLAAIAENSGPRLITQAQLLASASDVEGSAMTAVGLTISSGSGSLVDNGNGTWSYTPALNDDASVVFSYGVSDGSATGAGSATLDITPVVNNAPVGVADSYSVNEDSTLTVNWWDADWTRRSQITLSGNTFPGAANLADFPVLVKLNSSNIDYAQTQNAGQDLRFVDANGTLLAYEVEKWNEAGDSYVWVRVPQVDTTGSDQIFMYYGNAAATAGQNSGAVWSSSYSAVYHLGGTGGAVVDSTGNGNTGVATNGPVSGTGQVGDARAFDGVNDYVNQGDDRSLIDGASAITYSTWVNPDSIIGGAPESIISNSINNGGATTGTSRFALERIDANLQVIIRSDDATSLVLNTTSNPLVAGAWQYIAVTVDLATDTVAIYVNGVLQPTTSTGSLPAAAFPNSPSASNAIGASDDATGLFFNGQIDETRIATAVRSAAWVQAEYLNMTNSFVTVGAAVAAPATGGVLANDSDDGTLLSAVLVSGPANAASFSLNPDGTFTYTPVADYFGPDTFVYRATDGSLNSADITVSITVNPVNDPPANTVPGAQTVNEDTAFAIAGISISDVDAATATTQLTVSNGSINVSLAGGATVSAGANNSSTLTLSGTIAQINAALASVTYQGNLNFNGADTLQVVTSDLGNTGAGGVLTDSDSIAITVNSLNDAPVAAGSSTLAAVLEDTLSPGGATVASLFGTNFSDVADAGSPTQNQFEGVAVRGQSVNAAQGRWQYSTDGGGSWSNFGALSDTNALGLRTSDLIRFLPAADFNGTPTSLTVRLIDNSFAAFTGGALAGGATVDANPSGTVTPYSAATVTLGTSITAVNDAPTATITPASYAATEQVALTLHGTVLSIADVDAGAAAVRATVSVTSGILNAAAGTTGVSISGNGTSTVTLDGTLTQINNLLAGNLSGTLTYTANSDTPAASDTLTLTASDLGNTGAGGTLTGNDTATINITAVNDAPTATITPASYAATEQTALTLHGTGLSIADVDAGSAAVRATVSVVSGILNVAAGTTGVTISGNGTNTVTLDGTLTQINNLLAGNLSGTLTYTATSDTPAASETLTLTASDLGNAGTGGTLTGNDNAIINITAISDAPVNTVPGVQSTNEDTSLVFSSGNGNQISISDVDAGGSTMEVTLSVTNGTLTLSGVGGLTFVNGDGASDATMTFHGAAASINAALNGLTFAPAADFNSGAVLTLSTLDSTLLSLKTDANLQGWYEFSGNANDTSPGTAQNATLFNGAVLTTDLTRGQVLSLDGVDDYADMSAFTADYAGFTQGTISGWIKSTGTFETIFSISDTADTGSYASLFLGASGYLTYEVMENGVLQLAVYRSSAAINDGNWHHVAVTVGASGNSLYVDGQLATAGQLTYDTGNSATQGFFSNVTSLDSMAIGRNQDSGGGKWYTTGSLDDVRIYNRVLSAGEVASLANDLPLTDSDSVAITVNPVNDAPTAIITPLTYAATEQVALTLHGTGLSIADVDAGAGAVRATLTVTSGIFNAAAGTTGVTVTGNGTNTVTLDGTLSQINNLLAGSLSGTLSYTANSDTPAASATLTLTASDLGNSGTGGALTGNDTATINITAVNDAPTATITPASYAATEQVALTLHGTGLSIADVDAGSASVRATVSVISGILNVAAGTTGVTVSGNGTSTVTLDGTLTQINNLLAGNLSGTLTYTANSDSPAASATLTLTASDLGNTGTGGTLTGNDTATINITAVNDAPTATITPLTYAATEQVALTLHGTGLAIADIDAGGAAVRATVSVTSGILTAAAGTTGVTVTGSGTNSITLDGTLTQINNLLAGNLSGTLTYTANSDTPAASTTLTLTASDLGSSGTGGTLTGNDSATINITAVNDAPSGTNGVIAVTEDTMYTFTLGDFGFADAEGDTLLRVWFDTLPASGTLLWNGSAFAAGNWVSAIDITAGLLTYAPSPDVAGAGSASFTFRVQDNGGTANGGSDTDPSANTLTINIAAVNDAPTAIIIPAGYAATEQVALTLHGTGLSIADVDAGAAAVRATVSVASGIINATAGTTGVSISGNGTNSVTLDGTLTQINNLLAGNLSGTLTYTATSDTPAASTTLTLTASDLGNSGTGGTLTGNDTAVINITAVNDAPTATIAPTSYAATEQVALTLHGTGLSIADVDAGAAAVRATVSVTSGILTAGAGTTGVTVTGSGTATVTLDGTLAQINNLLAGSLGGTLTYTANSDTPAASATLTLIANDLGNTGVGGTLTGNDTAMINVTAVNDAPVNTVPGAQSVTEDAVLVIGGISISDVDIGAGSATTQLTVSNGRLNLSVAGGATITAGANNSNTLTLSGAQAQINAALATLTYQGDLSFNGADTLQIVTNDLGSTGTGGALTDIDTVAITVNPANDAPSLAFGEGNKTFTEGALAVMIDALPTVTDIDSVNFDTGTLTVTLSANASVDDRVELLNTGMGLGQIGVSGTNVFYGGTLIGTQAGGIGAVPFVVTFNANANESIAAEVMANIRFWAAGDAPSTATRTVEVVLTDGDGGTSAVATKQIFVANVNDAPANTTPGAQTVNEDAPLAIAGVSINDADAGGASLTTQLTVGSGSLNVSLASGATISAGANNSNTLTLSGTQAQINAALASLTYQGNLNFSGADSLQVVTNDLGNTGSGGAQSDTDTVAITVNAVNDAPVVTPVAPNVTFVEGGSPVVIDSLMTVSDIDSPNFDTGVLTVSITQNGTLADRLHVGNFGTGPGQVGTSGSNVTYGGVTIGTFSGGTSGGDPLIVTFNASATVAAVQEVAASIQFNNVSDTPIILDREVTFALTDGDGGTAASQTKVVHVQATNDAPVTTPVTLTAIAEDSGARLITQAELLANASDVDGPALTATGLTISSGAGSLVDNGNGTWTYTPALNDDTAVSFSYTVTDGSLNAAGTATLDITPVNDAPVTTLVTLTAIAEDSGARLITQAELLANATDVDGPALTATGLTISSGAGSLVDNGNGTWTYIPALNDDTAVSFSYTVTDGGLTAAGTANLDITPVNDAPVTTPVTLTAIAEDSGARLITQAELLANATDVDGPALTATGLTISSGAGSLVDNGNGTWTYTSALNDDTSVTFSYTVTDGSLTAAGVANLDITPVNDAPMSTLVTLAPIAEDSGARLITQAELLVNATDVDGPALTASSLTIASGGGSLVDNGNGTWTYTPALHDDTSVSFSYTITDGSLSAAGTANLDITPVNDAPVTTPVMLTAIAEDSSARLITQVELLANATDVDGPALTATNLVISAGAGGLVDNGNGTWTYTPALNDDTSVSFSYTITDGSLTAAGTANLDITPVNDGPVTAPVTLSAIAEDSGARLITQAELLANASDVDGPALTANGLAISAGGGSLIDNGNGTWTYTPALNDDTSVSFSYAIGDGSLSTAGSANLDITPANDAPITAPVTLTAIAEDSGARLITQAELLANASDVDGPSLTASDLAISSGSGSLVDNGNGTWTYTPALNDDTAVSFTYTVTDGSLNAAGTATLDITPVNDAPVTTPVTLAAIAEDSGARLITQAELLANASDVDGPALTATNLAIASGAGSLVDNGDGTWTFVPALNDDTAVSFSYTIGDGSLTVAGTANLDITPVNDAPVTTPVTLTAIAEDSGARLITQAELLANASDVDGPALAATGLTISSGAGTLIDNGNGTWTYTLAANDDTAVSFSYTVSDGSLTAAGTASLDITPVNDAPTTTPVVLAAIAEDSGARLITQAELLANATDVDGPALTAANLAISTGNGTLVDNGNGTWTFTPAANDDTAVSFSYTVSDGSLTAAGSASLDISPVNDPPATTPVTLTPIAEDSGSRLITQAELLANASDVDSPSLTAAGLTISSGAGSLVDNGNGTWTYTSALNDDTSVTFSYTVTDGSLTAAGTANLDITPVNDAPVTTPATLTAIAEDSGPRLITQAELLANAIDIDGPSLTATGLTLTTGAGTLVDNGNGTWTFTPALNDESAVSFAYTVSDGAIAVAAVANLDITPVNDAPNTTPVTLAPMAEDSGARVITQAELLANATDVDGPTLTAANLAISSGAGSLVDNGNGTWSYTPLLNDDTGVTFSYTVTDGSLAVINSTTLDLTPVNDAAIISGVTNGSVIEAGGTDNAVINQPVFTGKLTAADVDNAADTFVEQPAAATQFGVFEIAADGTWTYTLDNQNPDVQALNVGAMLSEQVTVRSIDGTERQLTIVVNGGNDAAVTGGVITGVVTGGGNNSSGSSTFSGVVQASDVDNPRDAFQPVTLAASTYGSFVVSADGTWTYILDLTNAAVSALGAGATLTDNFTVRTIDNTPQLVNIAILGGGIPAPGPSNTSGETVTPSGVMLPLVVPGIEVQQFVPGTTPISAEPRSSLTSIAFDRLADTADLFAASGATGDAEQARRGLTVSAHTALLLHGGMGFISKLSLVARQEDFSLALAGYDFGEYTFQIGKITLLNAVSGRNPGAGEFVVSMAEPGEPDGRERNEFNANAIRIAGISLTLGIAAWALRSGGLLAAMMSALPVWRQIDVLPILGDPQKRKFGWTEEMDEATQEEHASGRLGTGHARSYRV